MLREALGIPFTATYMKGRGNYLCLHRFEAFRESAAPSAPGTRPLAHPHPRALARRRPRPAIAPRSRTCPRTCPSGTTSPRRPRTASAPSVRATATASSSQMRQRAAESDVVIVNHHLLCADAAVRQSNFGEVIPRCSNAIVDEAHQLEDVGDAVLRPLGQQLSRRRPRRATSTARIGARLITDGERRDADQRRRPPHPRRLRGGSSRRCRCCGSTGRRRAGRRRACASKRSHLAPLGDDGATLGAAFEALEADIALAKDVPEDVLALGRRAAEITRRSAVPAARRRHRLRVLPRDARPGRLPQRVADRRLGDHPGPAARPDGRDRADVGDAHGRRRVRLRQGPPRRRPRHRAEARLRSSTTRARRSSICPRASPTRGRPSSRPPPRARSSSILKLTSGRAFVLFTSYANLREVHRARGRRARVPDPRPGHGAALGAAARLQGDAARRAPRHLELLAGRRRRRRGAELRHHRQAAVRVARRSGHGGARRGDRRARRDRRSASTRFRWPS